MTLILLQVMVQSISSTLQWIGLYTGIRALPDAKPRQWRWIIGSAVVFVAWLLGVVLLASDNFRASMPRSRSSYSQVGFTFLPGFREA